MSNRPPVPQWTTRRCDHNSADGETDIGIGKRLPDHSESAVTRYHQAIPTAINLNQ